MRISKKILAIALSILMAVSMMPFTVFAATTSVSDATELADAVANASAGDTVELLGNVSGDVTIPSGKDITLDLNGFTINGMLTNYGTATVQDGTVNHDGGYSLFDHTGSGAVYNYGVITLTDVTTVGTIINRSASTVEAPSMVIDGGDHSAAMFGMVFSGESNSTTVIESGNYTDAFFCCMAAESGSTVVVNDGSIVPTVGENPGSTWIINGGTVETIAFNANNSSDAIEVVVNGGTVNTIEAYGDSTVTINDGTVNTLKALGTSDTTVNGGLVNGLSKGADATITVTGGTFDESIDVTPYIDSSVTDVTNNGDGTYTVNVKSSYVAKIGDAKFNTLEEAIAAAQAGDTIELVADADMSSVGPGTYPLGDNHYFDITGVTLDLKGFTVTVPSHWGVAFTGTNGVIKNGTFYALEHPTETSLTNYRYGVDIWGPGRGNVAESGGEHATIELENLTCNYGIHCWNADVTIKNCTSTGSASYYAVWADENTHVTIESGTYTTNGAAVIGAARSGDGDGNISVEGGNFIVPENKDLVTATSTQSKPENVKFSGGTANVPINEINCADGFVPKDNGDGTYGVTPNQNDGMSLTLDDQVKINFYVNLDKRMQGYSEEQKKNCYVEIRGIDAAEESAALINQRIYYSSLVKATDAEDPTYRNCYKVPYLAAPAQITEEVTITVRDSGGAQIGDAITTSVADYCRTIIESSSDAKLVNLAKAMMDYGKAAADKFNYQPGTGYFDYWNFNSSDDIAEAEEAFANLPAPTISGNNVYSGFAYVATSLPALRLYLNISSTRIAEGNYKATITGFNGLSSEPVTPLFDEVLQNPCIDVTGIYGENLNKTITVEFAGSTLTISALHYAKVTYDSEHKDSVQSNFARSLYFYNKAASAYFA